MTAANLCTELVPDEGTQGMTDRNPTARAGLQSSVYTLSVSGNLPNAVSVAFFRSGFGCGGNILRTGVVQDLLGLLRPLRIVRMDRQQNPAIFHSAFISLGFVLGDSHADQSTR